MKGKLIMFVFELKKFFGKRTVKVSIIIYILISFFFFRSLTENVSGLKIEEIYGFFFDFEMVYMELLITLVCVIITQLIPLEYSTNMIQILSITKNGKKKFWDVKIKMALLLSNSFYFIYLLVVLISWIVKFGFNFDIPVIGEYYFSAIIKNHTINTLGEVLLIHLLAAFLSANTTALICLYLSNKLKKELLSSVVFLSISFILAIFPDIFGIRILSVFSPLALCHLDDCYYFGVHIGSIYINLYAVTLVSYVIVAGILLIRLKKRK